MLHRLLLTRDPPAVQLQVAAVVQETVRAAQEHLQRQTTSRGQRQTHDIKVKELTMRGYTMSAVMSMSFRAVFGVNWVTLFICADKEEEGEKDSQPCLGEGGEAGELVPGKSLVFAAMELLVFILVRHLPQLNTRVKESPSHVPHKPQRLPEESARLVANTVSILAELPSLCSPAGEAHGQRRTTYSIFYHRHSLAFVFAFLRGHSVFGGAPDWGFSFSPPQEA